MVIAGTSEKNEISDMFKILGIKIDLAVPKLLSGALLVCNSIMSIEMELFGDEKNIGDNKYNSSTGCNDASVCGM